MSNLIYQYLKFAFTKVIRVYLFYKESFKLKDKERTKQERKSHM